MKICTKAILKSVFLVAIILSAGNALALKKGDWIIKFGVAHVSPNDDSDTLTGAPTVGVGVESNTQLFITATYMYSKNVGIEVLASTPFKHDLMGTGGLTSKVGTTRHLPPTVSLQYHFNPDSKVKPYIGAGINYTTFFSEKAIAPLTSLSLKDSWGLAAQVGVDVKMNNGWYFNADARYINIETKATTNLGTVNVDINPWVFSIGLGKRF
jgi:outer membrane protein